MYRVVSVLGRGVLKTRFQRHLQRTCIPQQKMVLHPRQNIMFSDRIRIDTSLGLVFFDTGESCEGYVDALQTLGIDYRCVWAKNVEENVISCDQDIFISEDVDWDAFICRHLCDRDDVYVI